VRAIYTDFGSVRVFRLGVSLLHALAGGEDVRAYSLAWLLILELMGLASVFGVDSTYRTIIEMRILTRINNVPIFTVAIGNKVLAVAVSYGVKWQCAQDCHQRKLCNSETAHEGDPIHLFSSPSHPIPPSRLLHCEALTCFTTLPLISSSYSVGGCHVAAVRMCVKFFLCAPFFFLSQPHVRERRGREACAVLILGRIAMSIRSFPGPFLFSLLLLGRCSSSLCPMCLVGPL
jgi:hypothetical protein